jgi:hypothetical protein
LKEEIKKDETGAENTILKLNQTTQNQNSYMERIYFFSGKIARKRCNT